MLFIEKIVSCYYGCLDFDDSEVGTTYFRETLTIEKWKAEQQLVLGGRACPQQVDMHRDFVSSSCQWLRFLCCACVALPLHGKPPAAERSAEQSANSQVIVSKQLGLDRHSTPTWFSSPRMGCRWDTEA